MGVYLSTPSTETSSTDKCIGFVTYGASSMQGWRKSQEDAHNCCPEFDEESGTCLFAVYDGHGGAEVAEYASRHLPDFIRKNKFYLEKKLPEALIDAFLEFDAKLIDEEAQKELTSIAQLDKVESADENEADRLNEEAEMPIEDVLENYGGVQQLPEDVKNVYQNNQKFQKKLDQKYESPALRAKCNGPDKSDLNSVKTNLQSSISNGHLDENENGKCSSTVESTTTSHIEPSEQTVSAPSGQTENQKADVVSSSDDVVNGDNEAKAVDKDAAHARPDTATEDEKEDCAEPSSSNLPNEEEDDEEEDEGDEDEWSDTSSDPEEEEDGEEEGDEEELGDEENEIMATFNEEERPGYDSGCTAVVALLRDRQLHVANAGDSRCVLCRAGNAVDLSVDHKPEDELELARIKKAGGMVSFDGRVNGGLNLSRALGDHLYKKNESLELKDQMISGLPDIQSTQLQLDDEFMIIACDGIWNSLTSQEVVDFVRERIERGEEKMSRICEELFHHCLAPNTSGDGTGCDNMTAVIVRFNHRNADDVTSQNDVIAPRHGVKRPADDHDVDDNAGTVTSSKRAKTRSSDIPESSDTTTG